MSPRPVRLLVLLLLLAPLAPGTAPALRAQSTQSTRGDVDGDGRVTAADARAVMDHVAGHPARPGTTLLPNGDADGNGRLTSVDAAIISAFAAGRDVSRYPVGEALDGGRPGAMLCSAHVAVRTVECRGPAAPPLDARGSLILGGQNHYVTLTSAHVLVASDTFQFDVTVANLLPQAMGLQPSGEVDPNGVRVFFAADPVVTRGSGEVRVGNADGQATLTATDQPFFAYTAELGDGRLDPGETSGARNWKLQFDPGVLDFTFLVYVSAPVQHGAGWIDLYPRGVPAGPDRVPVDTLLVGERLRLVDTVRSAVGGALAGEAVTWGSSAGLLTPDGAGGFVAAAPGRDTIVAQAGERRGRYEVVITAASADSSFLSAEEARLIAGDSTLVTLTARDGFGRPLADTVPLSLAGSHGTLSPLRPLGEGRFSAHLRWDSVGTVVVTASVTGTPLADSLVVTYVAGTPSVVRAVSPDSQEVAVGAPVAAPPAVVVLDALGNPVPGVGIAFRVAAGGGSLAEGGGPVDSVALVTGADGRAGVEGWTAGTRPGVHRVEAAMGSEPPAVFTAHARAGPARSMTLLESEVLADTVGRVLRPRPAVLLADSFGNPVPGVRVAFTPTATGGVLGDSAATDSLGVARVGGWRLRTRPGVDSLVVSAPGLPGVLVTATALLGAPAFLLKSAGDGQTLMLGAAVPILPAVVVTDSLGNPVPGLPVTFAVSGGGGVLTGGGAVTDSTGAAAVGGWTLGRAVGSNQVTATAPGLAPVSFTATGRPNLLLIIADDLNDWVGPLGGHPEVRTPGLDRLAARGLTLERAYAAAPLCNPSRSALLTGLRPSTSGIYGNGPADALTTAQPGIESFPEFLRRHGYYALGIGKVFHSPTSASADSFRWNRYLRPRWPDPNPVASFPTTLRWGRLGVEDEAMSDHLVATQAGEFLALSGTTPFFVAAGLFRPHHPWHVPSSYFDLYPDPRLPDVQEDDLDDVPPAGVAMADPDGESGHEATLAGRPWKDGVQAYLASITFMDAQVGRILDALDASPYRENTIVVFLSDNGLQHGQKERWHKSTLWEPATRVPLIIVAPEVTTPGSRSARTVDLMSFFPTMAELAGIPVDVAHPVEGVSIRPLLSDPAAPWSRPAVSTQLPGNHAVRDERWRYIRYANGDEELYDHLQDPFEWNNLAGDPEYAGVIASLRAWIPAGS